MIIGIHAWDALTRLSTSAFKSMFSLLISGYPGLKNKRQKDRTCWAQSFLPLLGPRTLKTPRGSPDRKA
jgi:hypothetical protein